jgi:TPR repeat protein
MFKNILLSLLLIFLFAITFFWYFSDKRQDFLKLQCNVGIIKSCYLLGYSYKNGNRGLCSNAPQSVIDNAHNTIQSDEKAKEAFTKACNGGYIKACALIQEGT